MVKRAADRALGTFTDELYWRLRHVFGHRRWAEEYLEENSLAHPVRKIILDRVSACAPFRAVLEVGAASGPNLYLLSQKYPHAKLYGTDISAHAVRIGNEWFKQRDIPNVTLSAARAENLRRFSDKSIDISFTNATLIYIGPEKIEAVIREMLRVTRKALIFIEYHSENASARGDYVRDHWVRNYRTLLARHIPERALRLTPLPVGTLGGDWDALGHIVEARLD